MATLGNLTTGSTGTVDSTLPSTTTSFPNFIRPSVSPTSGCDIYGPLCQTGTIVVAVNLTSTTTITTVPCSYYVSAQSASVNFESASWGYDGKGPFDWYSSFGRSPECTSLLSVSDAGATTFSNCPNNPSGLRGAFTDYFPYGIYNIGKLGALGGYTCCGDCSLRIDEVRVFYFPGPDNECSTIGGSAINGTVLSQPAQSLSVVGSTAVVSGYTLYVPQILSVMISAELTNSTSPSIYLQVLGAATVSDVCGQVGPIRTDVMISLPPGGLSTASYPVPIGAEYSDPNYRDGAGGYGSPYGVTQAINTANFGCPTWGLGTPIIETVTYQAGDIETNTHYLVTTPFNPIIIPPPQLQTFDPVWASQCSGFYSFGERAFTYAIYDPPYALIPNGVGLDPSAAPLPTPAPIISTTDVNPIMTASATPAPGSPSIFVPKTVSPSSNMLQSSPSIVPPSPSVDPPAVPATSAPTVSVPQDPGAPQSPTAPPSLGASQNPGLPQTASAPQNPSSQDPGSPQNPSFQDPGAPQSPTAPPSLGASQNPGLPQTASAPQNPSSQDPGSPQNPSSPQTPVSPQRPNTSTGGSNSAAPSNLGGIIYSAFGGPNSEVASTIAIPNSSPGTIAIGGQPVTIINPSAVAVNGATYTAGGAAATISGEVISIASAGGGPGFSANTPGPSLLTIAGQTLSANPSALTIAGNTLIPGGPGVTVSGTPISLAPSGVVVVGSSSLTIVAPMPSTIAPTPSVITAGGQLITAIGTGALVFDHTTIVAGGPGATISGTPFSLAPSGTLIVGTSKVALPSGLGNATINPFKGAGGRVEVERWRISGGLMVVLSFVISSLITTACSIYAAILDGKILDEKAFLPRYWQDWLHKEITVAVQLRSLRRRRLLDRLILGYADQQLAIGLCLLISGYIKMGSAGTDYLYGAHFSLIVRQSCLSSSSHLAAVITLRKYLETYRVSGILRVYLVTIYALFLSGSIVAGMTFSPLIETLSMMFKRIFSINFMIPFSKIFISHALPVLLIIYIFWLAIIQLNSELQRKTERIIRKSCLFCYLFFRLEKIRIRGQARLSTGICKTLSRVKMGVKSMFWKCLFASPFFVFLLQIVFAVISLTATFTQKFMKNPDPGGCDLTSFEEDEWGFGQTLPMFFLFLPVLSAIETYFEIKVREETTTVPTTGYTRSAQGSHAAPEPVDGLELQDLPNTRSVISVNLGEQQT
ncbi:hypothetical protein MMC18_001007 [Xylographa bjoerkii]|nr:hypothetical protein [Xylographa bjoerkii]